MNKQCIVFLADGARADVFEYLLKRGDLPNISKYIIERGFYRKAVTVFPSTTGPAYIPYLLGMYPLNSVVRFWKQREIQKAEKILTKFPISEQMDQSVLRKFRRRR